MEMIRHSTRSKRILAGLILISVSGLFACTTPADDAPDSFDDAPHFLWSDGADIPRTASGSSGGLIQHHFNLTGMHGETEFVRNARWVDINGDGSVDILTRTMNQNRIRALDGQTGETLWVSKNVLPREEHPQVSQMAVGDIDGDTHPDATIVTYDGHVLCIDARDGSIKWQRKLPWHINNPDLHTYSNVTDDKGRNLVLTVSNDFKWIRAHESPRINFMRNPSVIVLNHDGSTAWVARNYAKTNSNGHKTWTFDIDGDGLDEVCANGHNALVWFDHDGTRLFSLPVQEGGHPDQVITADIRPERKGNEILYLDGIDAITVADAEGDVFLRKMFPRSLTSHLQNLGTVPNPSGGPPRLLAHNIRARDAKLLMFDHKLRPLWSAQVEGGVTMSGWHYPSPCDWKGDGQTDIVLGAVGKAKWFEKGDERCALQVMDLNGTPIYWHRWTGLPACFVVDSRDIDEDGAAEVLAAVGDYGGPGGRWGIAEGTDMHLYVFDAGAAE